MAMALSVAMDAGRMIEAHHGTAESCGTCIQALPPHPQSFPRRGQGAASPSPSARGLRDQGRRVHLSTRYPS